MNAKILKPENLIATDNPNAFVGAIVMWHLTGDVQLAELQAAWKARTLDEELLPDLPSAEVCLTRAIDDFTSGKISKKRIKGGGYRIDLDRNYLGDTADIVTIGNVTLDEFDKLVFTRFQDQEISDTIIENFDKHSKQLSSRDISPWLCMKLMNHFKATSLKSNGGVYFVPRERVDELQRVQQALQSVSPHRIYTVKAMTDNEAIDMVVDAIMREAEAEALAVEADLAIEDNEETGTKALGVRALRTRVELCDEMIEKVRMYEDLLDRKLDDVRKRLDDLKDKSMEAALTADAKKEEEGE